jgi:hypothetical protein
VSISAADRYDPDPDLSFISQGDLLTGLPVVFMPPSGERWVLLRPGKTITLQQAKRGMIPSVFKPSVEHDDPNTWEDSEELVVAKATKALIAVLTQTCDIEHRKHVQVAPVQTIAGLNEKKLESLRADDIKYWFYLPPDPPVLAEGYIDVAKIVSVHSSYLAQAHLVKRHSNSGVVSLQAKLAGYFGRPFGFNIRDDVPTTGDYMCLKCIYEVAEIRRVPFAAAAKFGQCSRCGEQTLWAVCPSPPNTRQRD